MDTVSTDRRGDAPSDLLSVLSPKACISDFGKASISTERYIQVLGNICSQPHYLSFRGGLTYFSKTKQHTTSVTTARFRGRINPS